MALDKLKNRLQLLAYQLKCQIYNQGQDLYRTLTEQNQTIVNQKEFRIAGLRRTGNHAVIGWIEDQHKLVGTTFHLNNVKIDENPYRHKHQNLSYYFPKHQWSIERYQKQAKGEFIKRDCLIYSYEDYSLSQIFSNYFEKKHDLYLGKTLDRYDLLIIRDPFNTLASRLKKNFLPVKSKGTSFVDLWIEYAREYLAETNYLKHNKICINYNLWVADLDYRKQLAQKLGIKFTDVGIDKVRSYGGGSSFEGKTHDGQASTMNTTNRWQYFVDCPIYRKLIDNSALLQYSERIFGHIPGTEILFD